MLIGYVNTENTGEYGMVFLCVKPPNTIAFKVAHYALRPAGAV